MFENLIEILRAISYTSAKTLALKVKFNIRFLCICILSIDSIEAYNWRCVMQECLVVLERTWRKNPAYLIVSSSMPYALKPP